jgi:hypothetical protein
MRRGPIFAGTAAMNIFDGLYHYAVTGVVDVKALKGKHTGKLSAATGFSSLPTGRSFASWPSRIAVRPIVEGVARQLACGLYWQTVS